MHQDVLPTNASSHKPFLSMRRNDVTDLTSLTHRETEILKLIADGKRNAEISATLHITVHTVETHLTSIYSKLAIRTRTEAAKWYWEHSRKQSDSIQAYSNLC